MASENVLLVEGRDDKHVFLHLLKHHQVPKLFAIKPKEGVDRLLAELYVELEASDLKRLGIVVDADTDLSSRWQALRNILSQSGYHPPAAPSTGGTIIHQPGKPSVGIWIMPDNTLPGRLEDFVAFLVPDEDPLWDQARGCLEQIPEQHRRFRTAHFSKAHVHTWLAWQEEPGTPMGLAITKRYLDAEAAYAYELMGWICRLFDV